MVGITGEGRVCRDKWSSWFGGCFGQVKVTQWRLSLKWSTQYWKGLTQGCKCWDAENQVRSMRTLSSWKWQGAWRTSNCKGHAEKEVAGNVREMQKWNRQSVAPWTVVWHLLFYRRESQPCLMLLRGKRRAENCPLDLERERTGADLVERLGRGSVCGRIMTLTETSRSWGQNGEVTQYPHYNERQQEGWVETKARWALLGWQAEGSSLTREIIFH